MATVQRKLKKKYVCSCGRSFAHAISLKRHKFVSGCVDEEPNEEQAAAEAPEEPKPEPEEEPVTVATQALTIDDITQLYALANERLHPTPTTAMRMREMSSHLATFSREFGAWLGQESTAVGRWLAARVPEVLGVAARGILSVVTLAAVVAIFFAGLTMGITVKHASATSEYVPAPQPPVVDVDPATSLADAASTVSDFYRSVNGGAFTAAYNRLSSAWRSELGYEAFVSGYARTEQVMCELVNVERLSKSRARVEVRLQVLEDGAVASYAGHYDLVQEGRSWRIDRGNLRG